MGKSEAEPEGGPKVLYGADTLICKRCGEAMTILGTLYSN
jgi:hypothetical protein